MVSSQKEECNLAKKLWCTANEAKENLTDNTIIAVTSSDYKLFKR
jgi:hypothetical protein